MYFLQQSSAAAAAAAGDESRKQLGAFLMQAQFQASVHSSNFVMTAAAQNLLCLQMAASVGVTLDDPFVTWLSGSCVPVLLGEWCVCCILLFVVCISVFSSCRVVPAWVCRRPTYDMADCILCARCCQHGRDIGRPVHYAALGLVRTSASW
jgi:hypothetical protein